MATSVIIPVAPLAIGDVPGIHPSDLHDALVEDVSNFAAAVSPDAMMQEDGDSPIEVRHVESCEVDTPGRCRIVFDVSVCDLTRAATTALH